MKKIHSRRIAVLLFWPDASLLSGIAPLHPGDTLNLLWADQHLSRETSTANAAKDVWTLRR